MHSVPCDHSISEVSCQSESVPYCALSARLKLRPYGAIKICLLLLLLLSSQIYQSGEFDAIIVAQRSAHIAGTTVIKVSGHYSWYKAPAKVLLQCALTFCLASSVAGGHRWAPVAYSGGVGGGGGLKPLP